MTVSTFFYFSLGIGLGVSAILWVIDVRATPAVVSRVRADGVQEVEVCVKDSYQPDRIRLLAGVPADLRFVRYDPAECASRLLIPSLGIDRSLPLEVPVVVHIADPPAGDFLFTCHYGMYHGRLEVKVSKRRTKGNNSLVYRR